MPRGDRTGPAGMGPMTGRAAGFCAGYAMPGFMNPVHGRGYGMGYGRGGGGGFGRGMGWGRGWGWAYPSAPYAAPLPNVPRDFSAAPQDEVTMLKEQAKYFGEALESVNRRITEIGKEKK
jgi:hypothetical protein